MSEENEEVKVYETSIEDYVATIGALTANTASTPYEVVITDGENLSSDLGNYIKTSARYVKLSFNKATPEPSDGSLSYCFGYTASNAYLVECDLSALDFTSISDTSYMFSYCTGLKNVTLPSMKNITDASCMFRYCTGLTSIELPLMTSATNVNYMFKDCTSLTEIDLSRMTSVTSAYSMFEGCTSLASAVVMPSISNAGRMFYGCTALTTIKNFKWAVEDLTDTTESESAENSMQNAFKNCTALAHVYYYSDTDLQKDCNGWRLYKKEGTSLKSYDTEGTEQDVETLESNVIIPNGKTLNLMFDTSTIDENKYIKNPYLFAAVDGSKFDANGGNYALLADDPEKVVTNIEYFQKLSASKKLVIPLTEPDEEDLVNGCMWIK